MTLTDQLRQEEELYNIYIAPSDLVTNAAIFGYLEWTETKKLQKGYPSTTD